MTDVAIVGAAGLVGRRITKLLAAAGLRVAAVVRRADARVDGASETHVADVHEPGPLARAIAGARVVVNAAGPLRDTAEAVLAAAIATRAIYVDVGGEQAVLRALYERHESAVRRAGLLAVPGAGLDGMLGDLVAVRAAAALAPTPDAPLDEIAVSLVFDDLALSAGSQRALFGAVFARPVVWRRDRWEPARAGDVRRVDAGVGFGGVRDAIAYAGGAPITLPRHVPARLVGSFAATTRKRSGVMRLLATALPLVPRAAEVLAAYAPPDTDYAQTKFAVVAQLRRGFEIATGVARGRDIYATTSAVTAWVARHLAEHGSPLVGMRAPCEVFDATAALTALDLDVEPALVSA